jgi:class 3 adenylate cyclase
MRAEIAGPESHRGDLAATGPGIMALFGAPLAHEDHAVRASYAALTVVDNVIRWESHNGHTGTVVLHEGDGKRVLIWTFDFAPDWSGLCVPKSH